MFRAVFVTLLCSLGLAYGYVGGWDPRYCCYPPPEECCPTEPPGGCPPCLDVAIIADRSSSVGGFRWDMRVIPFLKLFAESMEWTIGHGDDQYQVSITSFGTDVNVHWGFDGSQTDDSTALVTAIDAEVAPSFSVGGLSNLGTALGEVLSQVIDSSGDRPECDNLCILVTDGAVTDTDQANFDAYIGDFRASCDILIGVRIVTTNAADLFLPISDIADFSVHVQTMDDVDQGFAAVEGFLCGGPPECPECADLALVVDRSSSVGGWRWVNRVVPFLKMFATTGAWTIGIGETEYQVGVVTFGTYAELQWAWGSGETADATALEAAMDGLSTIYVNGELTNTGAGMTIAREQIIMGAGNRPDCPDVCIVITDGAVREPDSGDTPIFDAELPLFVDKCDKIITVAITTSEPIEALDPLTAVSDYVIPVETFNELENIFPSLIDDLCDEQPTVAPTTVEPSGCCPYDYPYYFRVY